MTSQKLTGVIAFVKGIIDLVAPEECFMAYVKRPRASIGLRLMHVELTNDSLHRVHRALETEISRGARMLDKMRGGNLEAYELLLDEECNQVEDLLGIAFLACQSFINRIRTHFVWVNRACVEDFGKQLSHFAAGDALSEVLKCGGKVPENKTLSLVEAIYAVGNFWKHSDEWPTCERKSGKRLIQIWDLSRMTRQQKATAEVAMALGLQPRSTGNMRGAARAVGVSEFEDLSPMRKALTLWAHDVYSLAGSQLQAVVSSNVKREAIQ